MKQETQKITQTIAKKVLATVDAGLVYGLGSPKPGQMCVEAAVCYALGLPHGDDPDCVSRAIRSLKLRLNDRKWSSNEARAKGLRRLALIQLGSAGALDDKEFARRVAELAIRKSVPAALRAAASIQKDSRHAGALRDAADLCEREPSKTNACAAANAAYAATNAATRTASYAATNAATNAAYAATNAATNAAYAAANAAANAAADAADAADAAAYAATNAADIRDKSLAEFCEDVVQILIAMKAPGARWLALTE